jgi:hypothetical protein
MLKNKSGFAQTVKIKIIQVKDLKRIMPRNGYINKIKIRSLATKLRNLVIETIGERFGQKPGLASK